MIEQLTRGYNSAVCWYAQWMFKETSAFMYTLVIWEQNWPAIVECHLQFKFCQSEPYASSSDIAAFILQFFTVLAFAHACGN